MKSFAGNLLFVAMLCRVLTGFAAWYDSPVVLRQISLGSSALADPHYMSKSSDDRLMLVNLQSWGDRAGSVLVDLDKLTDFAREESPVRMLVNCPSEAYGSEWKGGAVSAERGLVLFGSGKSSETCSASTEGEVWLKSASFRPLSTSTGDYVDSLAFGVKTRYVYSNIYTSGRRGMIARWTYSEAGNQLVLVNLFETGLRRIRNISVCSVNGRELVYCGEGEDTLAKVVAIDVTDEDSANWTAVTILDAVEGLSGNLTNVKVSGTSSETPVLHILGDDGRLVLYTLAADGLSVIGTVKTFAAGDLASAHGAISGHFRNFEVSDDGRFAFFLKAVSGEIVLSVVGTEAYLESNGNQALELGYYLKPTTRLEVDYQIVEKGVSQTLFGNVGDKGMEIEYVLNGSTNFEPYENGSWKGNVNSSNSSDLNRHTITFDIKGRTIVNSGAEGKTKQVLKSGMATTPLVFFARKNANGSYSQASSYRLYGVRIYEDDQLVHHYLPGVKSGRSGLYDSLTDSFFGVSKTDQVSIAGSYAMPEEDDVYVEATEDLLVDTGYTVGPETAVELDFMMTKVAASTALMEAGVDGVDGSLLMRMYVNGGGNHAWTFKDKSGSGAWVSTGVPAVVGVRRVQRVDSYADRVSVATDGLVNYDASCSSMVPASSRTLRSGTTLRLFGGVKSLLVSDAAEVGWGFARMRVYGLKIYEKGVLVRDLEPMRRKGTAVGVLRDRLTGMVIESMGGNALAAGTGAAEFDEPYADSQGNQIVDTGYHVSKASRIEVDFQMLAVEKKYETVFGAYEGTGNNFHAGLLVNTSGNLEFPLSGVKANGYWSGGMGAAGLVRHTAVVDLPNRRLVVSTPGAQPVVKAVAGTLPETTGAFSLGLFGDNVSTGFTSFKNPSKARIYQVRIYENGDLSKCLIPTVKGTQCGFYDTVGKVFKPSVAVAANKLPQIVPSSGVLGEASDERSDLYLESDGTQAIDTGYIPKATTRLELDCQLTKVINNYYLLGSWKDGFDYQWSLYVNYLYKYTAVAHQTWSVTQTSEAGYARNTIVLDRPAGEIRILAGGETSTFAMSSAATAGTSDITLGLFARHNNDGKFFGHTPMRVYGFRIYESDVLIHDYRPYRKGDVVGLIDHITGMGLSNVAAKANPFKIGGGCVKGDEYYDVPLQTEMVSVKVHGGHLLKVSAIGATRYRWFMNGQEIAGATGDTLEVAWIRSRQVDTYSVQAIYEVNGQVVEGEIHSVDVQSRPLGLMIIFR